MSNILEDFSLVSFDIFQNVLFCQKHFTSKVLWMRWLSLLFVISGDSGWSFAPRQNPIYVLTNRFPLCRSISWSACQTIFSKNGNVVFKESPHILKGVCQIFLLQMYSWRISNERPHLILSQTEPSFHIHFQIGEKICPLC